MTTADDVETLLRRGWYRLPLTGADPARRRIGELREACAAEFVRLHDLRLLGAAAMTTSGQFGFTADGDESTGPLRELRSHLVLHQSVPPEHPLHGLTPAFYGLPIARPEFEHLAILATDLGELLDRLTLEAFEAVEMALAMPFGRLAGPLAMGERLLRLQWYPPMPPGQPRTHPLDTAYGASGAGIVGLRVVGDGSRAIDLVRASPHRDIGHWTWQLLATDSALRFWDESARAVRPAPAGPWIYGNACEFLEFDVPGVPAPVHWVDADAEATARPRLSVSCFAHVRPTAPSGDITAGHRLYRRLRDLGYVGAGEVDDVAARLSTPGMDDALVAACLAWEKEHAGPPPGFAAGVSRYYITEPSGTASRVTLRQRTGGDFRPR
ncbi:hypothetical protein NCC78_02400 [Micromonospora phytophila]|uniref:hypothetical protein n=1 Tax=Micromonospora phytophila TaxID=709888 RepID=UPI00202E5147|nr:hypothetical protein [Micromonospora phytophila]MCM0673572.1 hypothetical protein [Micromonospora phytophila]